jgi:hypothetical protein
VPAVRTGRIILEAPDEPGRMAEESRYQCRKCASTWKDPSIPMRFGKAQILHPRSAPPKAIPDSRAFVMPPQAPLARPTPRPDPFPKE